MQSRYSLYPKLISLARKSEDIRIFEDGKASRDFVYIDDVIDATYKCISDDIIGIHSLNIGSGIRTSINQISKEIVQFFKSESRIINNGEFRMGDIRHNYADITRAKDILDYNPKCNFKDGLKKFLKWASLQPIPELNFDKSLKEMDDKGLFKKSNKG